MRYKILAILLTVFTIFFATTSCSAPNASSICPPMGTITTIDNSELKLNVNNLVNSNMPNFYWDSIDCKTLENLSKSSSLSQFIGNPIIIVFHKSMHCPGCEEQLPYIKSCYDTWKNKGLTIINIYRSDKPKDARSYAQSHQIEFITLADPSDIVARNLGFAIGAPMSVLIDSKGIIRHFKIGPFKSQEELENILKSI